MNSELSFVVAYDCYLFMNTDRLIYAIADAPFDYRLQLAKLALSKFAVAEGGGGTHMLARHLLHDVSNVHILHILMLYLQTTGRQRQPSTAQL